LLRHEGAAKSTQTPSQKLVFAHLATPYAPSKECVGIPNVSSCDVRANYFLFFIYVMYLLKYQITSDQLDYNKKKIKIKIQKLHLKTVEEIVLLKAIKLFFSILIKKR
jgi:hypothetical protein